MRQVEVKVAAKIRLVELSRNHPFILEDYLRRMRLCHEMGGEEHVLKSVSAKDDLVASSKLVDAVEDLIPGVLGHEADERIQTDDGLLTEMVENSCLEDIGFMDAHIVQDERPELIQVEHLSA